MEMFLEIFRKARFGKARFGKARFREIRTHRAYAALAESAGGVTHQHRPERIGEVLYKI
jgi:hypothetical protein